MRILDAYPTIKEFRDGTEYAPFCYTGSTKEAVTLLTVLVDAADGDGDSWAELKSIKYDNQKQIEIVALITNEGREIDESYTFPICEGSG